MCTVINTPEGIALFRLLQLKGALKLEMLGMRHSSGRSVATQIRKELGLKARDKRSLYAELVEYIDSYSERSGFYTPGT